MRTQISLEFVSIIKDEMGSTTAKLKNTTIPLPLSVGSPHAIAMSANKVQAITGHDFAKDRTRNQAKHPSKKAGA